MGKTVLHANLRSRRASQRVEEFNRTSTSKKLSRSFFVPGRKASRRRASFAEHTTRFDSLAPSASSRFRTRMCVCVCERALCIYFYMYVSNTGRSVTSMRKKREGNKQADRARKRERNGARANKGVRVLSLLVCTMSILYDKHT